jgi:hypothetical protein
VILCQVVRIQLFKHHPSPPFGTSVFSRYFYLYYGRVHPVAHVTINKYNNPSFATVSPLIFFIDEQMIFDVMSLGKQSRGGTDFRFNFQGCGSFCKCILISIGCVLSFLVMGIQNDNSLHTSTSSHMITKTVKVKV